MNCKENPDVLGVRNINLILSHRLENPVGSAGFSFVCFGYVKIVFYPYFPVDKRVFEGGVLL